MKRILLIFLFLPIFSGAQNIIVTVAGYGKSGYSGDGGLAINSQIDGPDMLTLDKDNNIYFGDCLNYRIRKISASTGIITTIAGNGAWGFSGDGGPATNAQINFPDAFVFDAYGNLYFGDAHNYRVRKIDAITGIITTIAGNGVPDYNGDGIPASNAQVGGVIGICIDKYGNLFMADYSQKRIRKINAATGIISTVAGDGGGGYGGDGGPAKKAQIDGASVFLDSLNNLYIADEWNHRVRRVDAVTGIITTIAGNGTPTSTGDGGLAKDATVALARGIFIDKGQNIYITEEEAGRVRKIDAATGIISTVAGNGVQGHSGDGGQATKAQISCTDVYIDSKGVMYISGAHRNTIRKVYHFDSSTSVSICPGDSSWLKRNMPDGKWTCSDPQIASLDTFDKIIGIKSGVVTFVHENNALSEKFIVTVNPVPSISADIKPVSCDGINDGSIVTSISNSSGPYLYRWQSGDTVSSIYGLNTGIYTVHLKDVVTGCSSTDSFAITQPDTTSCKPVIVYNVISPNGDGINDLWVIDRIHNYPSNRVQVFDKWGDIVYDKNGYNNDWSGLGKNGMLPDGIYYYLVKLNAPNMANGKNIFTGSLMVVR